MIAQLDRLIEAVLDADTNRGSYLHGEGHWKCVAWTGISLAHQTTHADAEIAFLFGLFHDSQRRDDGSDPDHGRRAAMLVQRMNDPFLSLSDARLSALVDACAGHVDGRVSGDPTIGVCWDADRLNLCRLGMVADHRYLSSAAAKRPEASLEAERFIGQRKSWREICVRVSEQ